MDLLLMLALLHIDLELVDLMAFYHYVFVKWSHAFTPRLARCNHKVQDFAQSNDRFLASFVTKSKCYLYFSRFFLCLSSYYWLIFIPPYSFSWSWSWSWRRAWFIPKPLFIFLNYYNSFICIGQFFQLIINYLLLNKILHWNFTSVNITF